MDNRFNPGDIVQHFKRELLTEEEQALVRVIQILVEELPSLGRKIPPEITSVLKNVQEAGALADLIANGSGLPPESLQKLLEIVDPLERLRELHIILVAETEKLRLQKRIQDQAQEEMNRHQRDYFIREQMRALQAEAAALSQCAPEFTMLGDCQTPKNIIAATQSAHTAAMLIGTK